MKERKCPEYNIEFFTDIMALDMYCRTNRPDMIVIAEYLVSRDFFETGEVIGNGDEHIVLLVDDDTIKSINGIEVVYRYQPVNMLMDDILNLCADMTSVTAVTDEYVRKSISSIVSIYSPVGRCGKTLLSVNMGTELAARGYRVLLVNLEGFSVLMRYINMNQRADLSDLLYFYMSSNAAFHIKAEAVIGNYNGFDYIPPVSCIRDLRETDTEVIMKFVNHLGDIRGYDIILIDLSDMIKDVFKAMEMSDIVVMPITDEEISTAKAGKFREYIENTDYDISSENIYDINMSNIRNFFDDREFIGIVDELERRIRDR